MSKQIETIGAVHGPGSRIDNGGNRSGNYGPTHPADHLPADHLIHHRDDNCEGGDDFPVEGRSHAALSGQDYHLARRRLRHFSLRTMSEVDLLAEREKRRNDLARLRGDLAAGDVSNGDADQLRGGIEYEFVHIEAITQELEHRERALVYGYRCGSTNTENHLRERFDRAKQINLVELIRTETGQVGTRAGTTWKFYCPFHADGSERTASLVAYPDGHFHCFGCETHGTDPVAFVAELRGIGQVEALRLLESGVVGIGVPL